MLAESGNVLAASHVPQLDRAVPSRGQGLAVRTEGNGLDPAMPLEGSQQLELLGTQRRQQTQPETGCGQARQPQMRTTHGHEREGSVGDGEEA